MQTRNKIIDDLSQLMTNAMGVAQGARTEAETALKGMLDRFLADRDLVTREEFDAARAMAQKAREENETLKAELASLSERLGHLESASRKPKKTGDSD
jgi:BMFP domain-containing protein YqiC